jgi:hypothetical protein
MELLRGKMDTHHRPMLWYLEFGTFRYFSDVIWKISLVALHRERFARADLVDCAKVVIKCIG